MINTALIKSPMNWLFIGFAVFLLTFLSDVIFKDTN